MPSPPAASWSDTPATAERVVVLVERIASVLRAEAWRAAAAEGLTPTQAELLTLLAARAPGRRLGWLAQQLSITPATASDAVTTLVAKGWVKKSPAADDARAVALAPTRAGRALARRLAKSAGMVRAGAAALPASVQEQLLAGLLTWVGELQRNEAFPALRTCVTCEHFEPHAHPDAAAPHHCHLVGAALPATMLRVDCAEHQPAAPALQRQRWQALQG